MVPARGKCSLKEIAIATWNPFSDTFAGSAEKKRARLSRNANLKRQMVGGKSHGKQLRERKNDPTSSTSGLIAELIHCEHVGDNVHTSL